MTPCLCRHLSSRRTARFGGRIALASGGLAVGFASFESCEAALVFTAPFLEIDPEIDPIYGRIDLNGDGRAEVGIAVCVASFPDGAGNVGAVHGGGLFGAEIAFSGKYPTAFHRSAMISSGLNFRTAIGAIAVSSGGRLGSRGNWFAGNDAYLGARFRMDGIYYYGWVHAVWDPAINTMRIDLAAYEDTGAAAHIIPQPTEPEHFEVRLGAGSDPLRGRIELLWPVLAGKTYELQRSHGEDQWETIHSVTPRMDGEASFVDDEFSEDPRPSGVYRAKQSESSLLLLALGVPRGRRKPRSTRE